MFAQKTSLGVLELGRGFFTVPNGNGRTALAVVDGAREGGTNEDGGAAIAVRGGGGAV